MFCVKIYNPETGHEWKIRRQNNGLEWKLSKKKDKYIGVDESELIESGLDDNQIYEGNSYYSSLGALIEKCFKLELLDKNTDANLDIVMDQDIISAIKSINRTIEDKAEEFNLKIEEDLFNAENYVSNDEDLYYDED